ncbi:MAG: 4Fe-4S binding protein [Prevotella sp.]|nr:4Fe-4S binding protein [Prevotella sp.]
MLRKIRTTLAVVFFAGITLLFLDFTGTIHRWLHWMAHIQLVPALLTNTLIVLLPLLLTLVFGRIYCSVICPLGVFQDLVSWFHNHNRKRPYTYSKAKTWLRWTMLGVMVAAFVAGIGSLVALLEPYSAYGRIAATLFQPLWQLANNALAAIAERIDSYAFYSVDVWVKSMPTLIISAATFIIICILAWRGGRTYCNTICPVGTLLGALSRLSWLKVHIDTGLCRNCGSCAHYCKASCIDVKNHTIDPTRCVVCGDCIGKCSFGAITYGHQAKPKTDDKAGKHNSESQTSVTPDIAKRSFLLATAMATTAAMAQEKKKVDGGLAKIEDKVAPERQTPLTPPGSLSARNLAKRCTGCQLCVSKCPNGVLRPSTELTKLMQPVMSYERGYCRPECTDCSEVCPTGAIRHIAKADKSAIQIGHAVWVKKNCIPLTDGVSCGNCARHCPTGAIEMVPSMPDDNQSPRIPVINEARCIGCGACENLCPARPFSAIYVEGHEVHRTI